jgi:rhamnogalacturonyl hydrolase YesR
MATFTLRFIPVSQPLRLAAGALLLSLLPAVASGAGPYRSRDNPNAQTDLYEGHYPVPYQIPTPEELKSTLATLHAYLDSVSRPSLRDGKTGPLIDSPAAAKGTAEVDGGRLSPLHYATGVVHNSMLLAAAATGDRRYASFTTDRFQFLTDHLPYFTAVAEREGAVDKNPFRNLIVPTNLDACGALGAAMIKARLEGWGPDLEPVIQRFANYIRHGQQRLPDGTLSRPRPHPDSVWVDDLYMSVPFLAQMGRLTGERAYFDDAARQVIQFSARLLEPNLGLFAHGWHAGAPGNVPRYYWGRANGWAIAATAELLDVLPEDHPARPELLDIFRTHARGIVERQSGYGLWHQMLDRTDSPLETSCSGLFVFALSRGIRQQWISAEDYGPATQAAWNGIASRITSEGRVEGTCAGTNYAFDMVYYYNRPMVDDSHGYGPVILAASEMLRLVQDERIRKHWRNSYLYSRGSR